jgi:hypothetical protein
LSKFLNIFSGLQATLHKNIGLKIGHFEKKYRANIGLKRQK